MTNNFYKICAANGAWFYKNEILERTGLVNHAFSTRIGGVSEGAYSSLNLGVNSKDEKQNVLSNFQLFSEAIGIRTEKMVLSNQVHDDRIRIVTKADCGKGVLLDSDIKGIDALITAESGVALATFYADCTPVLIVDIQKKVIASVHSGWRGTLLKIAPKTVLKMTREFGCDPKDMVCAIGPSIKQCHFEVGKEVYDQFVNVFGQPAAHYTIQKNGKYYVNTDALNVDTLATCGVPLENISICPLCTFCHNDVFYSHRGDGGITGRMCAVIELR